MEEHKLNLLELLDYIDPAMLNYQEWVNVGMALKYEGYSVSDWDSWSQRDSARYHDGETEKKWNTFDGSTKPVTGATITQLAKDNGWKPYSADSNDSFDWGDSFVASIDKGYQLINKDYIDGEKVLPPKTGYTLSGMDRDSMPDFFIQKRGHLLSPRYTINSPQKS